LHYLPLVDFLGKKLDDYIETLPIPVYVIRMGKRSGLIRARLRGIQHCICPLLFCKFSFCSMTSHVNLVVSKILFMWYILYMLVTGY